jgi:GDP-D-mannose 3', 5'-epimerase
MPRGLTVVTGAGGFIGHHLVERLKRSGCRVRGVDLRRPEFGATAADEFEILDLRRSDASLEALRGATRVFALAANMGGIGFIETHKAEIVRDNALINLHTLEAARVHGVKKFLFASSACVYPAARQASERVAPLREEEAYPADAEDGYGWEKLFMERQCRHYREDFGLESSVARFHNIYGPLGTYEGGREKSPAAICRKVAAATDGDEIEVWGDGRQARSYCYVDDCIEGVVRLMDSTHRDPINIGAERVVTLDGLVEIVARIAGKRVSIRHDLTKPVGVRGRSSDNTTLRRVLGWEPATVLEEGLAKTYGWIEERMRGLYDDALVGSLPR